MAEPTIACSLDLAAQERRLAEFAELASIALLEASRTPRGARFRLRDSDSVRATLRRLVEAERRCCSFLSFEVEVGDGGIRVDVDGPPAARPLIERLFEL